MNHYTNENGAPVCRAVAVVEYGVPRLHLVRDLDAVDCPACKEIVAAPVAPTEEVAPLVHRAGEDYRPVCQALPENGVIHLAMADAQITCPACQPEPDPGPAQPADDAEPAPARQPRGRRRAPAAATDADPAQPAEASPEDATSVEISANSEEQAE